MEYRPGRLNTVADALSRREPATLQLDAVFEPTFTFFSDLSAEFQEQPELRRLRDTIVATRGAPWRVEDGLILRGRCVFIPTTSMALPTVLQLAHMDAHEGIQKTL